jgi:fructose-specific phosphotransferase system IIC component
MSKGFGIAFKVVMTVIVAWIAFGIFDRDAFGWIVTVGVVASIVNYFVGDLLVLPRLHNIGSSVVDGFLSIVVAYVIALITRNFVVSLLSLIMFGILVACVEFFFHRLMFREESDVEGTKA